MIASSIEWQVDLLRLDAATRAKILPLLTKLEKELVAQVTGTERGKKRTETLLKQARALIEEYYAQAQAELFETTEGLARVAAKATAKSIPVELGPSLPPADMLKAIASEAIVQGATQADWWKRQSADTAWRFSGAVRQGLVAGETNQQIIDRIAGKQGFPGVMEISRKNAAALVQTSVQTVANNARLATFKANDDVIARLTWVTALDSHVCEICAARADLSWTTDGEPIGHKLSFENPPIHFNDRCVLVPETKTFKELGIDLPEPDQGKRASGDGPVPVSTTFADWLAGRTEAQQNEQFGPGRAALFRDGKITLQDLTNGRGRPLSLAELEAKYA